MNEPFRREFPAFSFASPLEVRLAPSDATAGLISGYASTFNDTPDTFGTVVAPGAFAKSLSRYGAERAAPAMLWGHDPEEPIGVWTSLREDQRGLLVQGEVNKRTQRGSEAIELLKQGAVTGLSIGFIVPKGGRTFNRDGTNTLTEVDLMEVSLTPIPSNRNARILDVRSIATPRQFEGFLREAGFSKSAACRITASGWKSVESCETDHETIATLVAQVRDATKSMSSQRERSYDIARQTSRRNR